VAEDEMPGYVVVKNFGPALETLKTNSAWHQVYPYIVSQAKAFIQYKTNTSIFRELLTWTDKKGNLLQTKVRQWMEGIVSKFATDYNSRVSKDEV